VAAMMERLNTCDGRGGIVVLDGEFSFDALRLAFSVGLYFEGTSMRNMRACVRTAYMYVEYICSYDVMRVGTLPMLVRNTLDLESSWED
jgi:hypothetical protein